MKEGLTAHILGQKPTDVTLHTIFCHRLSRYVLLTHHLHTKIPFTISVVAWEETWRVGKLICNATHTTALLVVTVLVTHH